ncbi:MAG TPA: YdbL family protein [Caulobacteraceae bacterium]|nr:YdbL family protein [Caulobacteraceae bacterium]
MTMMRDITGAAFVAAALATAAAPAIAQTAEAKARVDAAKAQGIVGEQSDGMLGFVTASTDTALRAAVAEINAGRAEVYRTAAAKNGVEASVAGASAFKNHVFPRMPAGQFWRAEDGSWKRK